MTQGPNLASIHQIHHLRNTEAITPILPADSVLPLPQLTRMFLGVQVTVQIWNHPAQVFLALAASSTHARLLGVSLSHPVRIHTKHHTSCLTLSRTPVTMVLQILLTRLRVAYMQVQHPLRSRALARIIIQFRPMIGDGGPGMHPPTQPWASTTHDQRQVD